MKKRILSIVLALCMVMAIMPQAVFANSNEDSLPDGDLSWEYDVWIGGTPVTRSQLAGPGWLFDPDTYTLTLRPGFTSSGTANLQDSTERAAVIYVKSDHSLTIELEGDVTLGAAGWENALTSNNKYLFGIYALKSDVTITGSHTLNVYGSDTAVWCKCLTVDGTKLNCRSYYTAVKVCSNAYSYFSDSMNGEDDMVVKNGAEVFAKTIHGLGIRPNGVLGSICHSFSDYGGGAGIFVNGSLRVENSTVDAENTCYELPPPMGDALNGTTTVSRSKIFCASICVHDDVVVSGSNARVTGKLENKADNFGEGGTLYSKLGAVMAKNFKVREGGTIEGFITSDYFTQVAQGLRRLGWYKDARYNIDITPASITLDGEGTVRNGINRMESLVSLGTEEFQYTDIGPYVFKEDTTATSCGTLSGVKATLGAKAQFNVGISNAPGDGSVNVKWQYSADDGATWVDVVSPDESENISMNVLEMVFSQIWSDGTVIKRYEILSSSMTINKTTADMDGWKVRCVLTDAVGVYYSNTVELSIDMPNYTVTFNTDGGTEITSKTTVQWTDTVLNGITAPTKDGWKFIGWKYGDVTVTPQTTYKELAADATVTSIELKAQWEDITAPTGEISIGKNSWKAFLNKITFGLFFNDTKTVTITASDNSGDEVTVSYLLSDKALTADDLAEKKFTAYTGGFDIEPNNEWIIYVMLTDEAGNVTYLSSDGIVLDNVAPVVKGVENGKTYCGAQTVTVDEKYIDSVTVNGTEITLQNNQFTLPAAEGTQKIVATDKAGNVSAEITVTVNDGHTDENKDHKCDYCDENVGVHEDKNKDHACDYGCSAIFGEHKDYDKDHACDYGCDVAIGVHEDKNKDHKCEYCGEEVTTCKDDDKDHLCDICGATLSEHTGGTATCKDKAVCEYCGEEYGELDSENHAGGTEIRGEIKATYLAEGYTGDTFCIGCGEKLSVGEVIPKLTHDDPTHGVEFYTNCSASGHNYKAYKWPATEFTMGSTQYICDKCGDEYWDNYTKKDTSEKIIMPSGKDFEFYITPNSNSPINKDNVKNNPILQAFLQDPSGTLKRMEDDGIKMYKIIEGAEQTVASKAENIVFRSDAPFKEFDQVMINGLVLDKKYYSVKKGSTIVTLNEDFAKEIPTGMHLFGIISKDGVAITTFTVDDKAAADNDTKSPQTGESNRLTLWIALFFVSGGAIATTGVSKKKKHGNTKNQ